MEDQINSSKLALDLTWALLIYKALQNINKFINKNFEYPVRIYS